MPDPPLNEPLRALQVRDDRVLGAEPDSRQGIVARFNSAHFVMSREQWAIRSEKSGASGMRDGWPKQRRSLSGRHPFAVGHRPDVEAGNGFSSRHLAQRGPPDVLHTAVLRAWQRRAVPGRSCPPNGRGRLRQICWWRTWPTSSHGTARPSPSLGPSTRATSPSVKRRGIRSEHTSVSWHRPVPK